MPYPPHSLAWALIFITRCGKHIRRTVVEQQPNHFLFYMADLANWSLLGVVVDWLDFTENWKLPRKADKNLVFLDHGWPMIAPW